MKNNYARLIKRPLVTEKTTWLAGVGQYTFEVARDANKIEIARAVAELISELYPKNRSRVVKVTTAAMRGRIRRTRRHGRAPHDSKKAYVTIEGDPLEIFGA